MKKILMVFVVGLGLVACSDNSGGASGNSDEPGGGMLDSNVTAPAPGGAGAMDNTTVQPDTSISDTGTGSSSSGGRSGGSGGSGNVSGGNASDDNSPGKTGSGKSTGSDNSGSTTDDNKGTN